MKSIRRRKTNQQVAVNSDARDGENNRHFNFLDCGLN